MPGTTNSIGGITGSNGILASTSGNTVNTVITTKGDLIIFPVNTIAGAFRNPVTTDNFVFTTNPAKPSGMGWEASGTGKWISRGIGGSYNGAATNAWFPVTYSGNPGTSSALTANRLICFPFFADRAWTIKSVSMICAAFVAASTVRIGIYDATGPNGYPGALITDAGTISTASNGTKTITLTNTLYGHYWLVYIGSSTATMNGSTLSPGEFAQAIGRPDTATGINGWFVYEDGVPLYLSGLPVSLASDIFTISTASNIAYIYFGT